MDKKNLKYLTPFKCCIIQNFPFIEEDFDAITNYQLLCKVVEYLNNTITAVNKDTEQVSKLTDAFNNLKDYVDSYFTDLNIQNEIIINPGIIICQILPLLAYSIPSFIIYFIKKGTINSKITSITLNKGPNINSFL